MEFKLSLAEELVGDLDLERNATEERDEDYNPPIKVRNSTNRDILA